MENEITIGLLNECFIKSETKEDVWLVTKTAFRFMITKYYDHFAIWKGYMNDTNQTLICELGTVPQLVKIMEGLKDGNAIHDLYIDTDGQIKERPFDIAERVSNYYKGKEAQKWTNNN